MCGRLRVGKSFPHDRGLNEAAINRRLDALAEVIGETIARERQAMREHVRGEIEALRSELAQLRSESRVANG